MSDANSFLTGSIEVKLDGVCIELPPERRSFIAIRSYLEALALQQQRILCALNVDGESVNLTQPRHCNWSFTQVEAETMSLNEVPAQLIQAALQQATAVRSRLQTAVELVIINPTSQARELWWNLSTSLKEPLLTLSLLPDHICGPSNGRASLTQLRQWQLEQLGRIIQEVDEASYLEDTTGLSDALEKRALPWLDSLVNSLTLWQKTILSDSRATCQNV